MAAVANTLVVGPGGKVVPVPTEHAAQYAALGYGAANERQVADYERDQEFSTPGQQLVTGLEAAGATATFGLSTHLEKAFGVNPEDIETRERVNPIAHGLGTAAGFVVPALIPGVGEVTAPGLISRAGRGVAEAVGEALPQATGLLGRAAARAAELGSGSAIEGGLWATGQVVHERALNPQLSAENALHTIGLGVVLGGTPSWPVCVSGKNLKQSKMLSTLKGKRCRTPRFEPNSPRNWQEAWMIGLLRIIQL